MSAPPATADVTSNNTPTLSDLMEKLSSLEKKMLQTTPQKRPRDEQIALVGKNVLFVYDNNIHTGTVLAVKKSWVDVSLAEKVTDQDGLIVENISLRQHAIIYDDIVMGKLLGAIKS
jgi:hypothetical protein